MTTAFTTSEQQEQQARIDAIRAEMHQAQIDRMNQHNQAKRGYIGQGTRPLPTWATR